jgi:hypothetical protein
LELSGTAWIAAATRTKKAGPYKESWKAGLFFESMTYMESISGAIGKLFDKLPLWARLIWVALTIVGSVYCIAHYGFLHFLLRVIFSP